MNNKIRIGALVSGSGSNLKAIIDSCNSGKVDGEVVFVGADNFDSKGLERSKNLGIPTFVVDYKSIIQSYNKDKENFELPGDFDFKDTLSRQKIYSEKDNPEKIKKYLYTRAAAEAAIIKGMEPFPFDVLVLAGFMRTFSPYFIDRVNIDSPRIMNIHPALLPSFPGVDGYGDTFRYGCKIGGCTVHYIDYGEDTGPILGQKAFEILPEDTLDSVKAKGLKLEWELFSECLQELASKK